MNNKKLDGVNKINKKNPQRSKEIVLNIVNKKRPEIKKQNKQNLKKNIGTTGLNKIKKNTQINIKINYKSFKRSLFLLTLLILIIINFYLIFITAVLRLDLDNGITRFINKFFPVPAIISEEGIIDYYDFKDSNVDIRKIFKQNNKYKLFSL